MLKFKKVEFKNFNSFGNTPTTITFNDGLSLINGSNGSGKCVRGNTRIRIKLTDADKDKWYGRFDAKTYNEFFVSIKTLIGYFENRKDDIYVETRFGWKRILAGGITAKNSNIIRTELNDSSAIETSPEHLLLSEQNGIQKFVKVNDLLPGDCLFDFKMDKIFITDMIKLTETEDLYDIQVEEVSEYLANGIVSHNSSIMDVIYFGLYGKPFRKVKKGELVNNINKHDCLVSLWFEKGSNHYQINRGIHPIVFEIFKNGELLPEESHVKDYQEIVNEVIGLSQEIVKQVIFISISQFQSFFEMPAYKRREILEQLLSLQKLGKMFQLNKRFLLECSSEIRSSEKILENYKNQVLSLNSSIKSIKSNNKDEGLKNLVIEFNENIKNIDIQITELESQLKDFNITALHSDLELSKAEKELHNKNVIELKTNVKILQESAIFFGKNDSCDTCYQPISNELKFSKLGEIKAKVDGYLLELEILNKNLHDEKSKIKHLEKDIKTYESISHDIIDLEKEKKNIANRYNFQSDLINKNSNLTESVLTEQLQNELKKCKELEASLVILYKDLNDYKSIDQILSDSGLKLVILEEYIPFIQERINYYLSVFDLFATIEIDHEFGESIKMLGFNKASFGSCSEGQKARITLSSILAFRDLMNTRGIGASNLLFIDEILDASLDNEGKYSVLKRLKQLSNDDNVTSFIVSHSKDLPDIFNYEYIVKQDNFGFSSVEEKIL